MSVIKISCVDQAMTFTNTPVIASGGLNEDQVEFTFCSLWDGYAKTAVFYKESNIYYVLIDDATNQATVPYGVLNSSGRFYISVVGYNGDVRRTSEVLPYTVVDGAVSPSPEPSTDDDIYAQMLALVTEAHDIATETKADQVEFEQSVRDLISENQIVDGTVTTAKLADNAVTSAKMANGSVTAEKLGAGAVTAVKLAADAVGTANILDGSVTADKLAADVADSLGGAGVQIDLIWSNARPNSEFAAQTVSMDLAAGDLFLVLFNMGAGATSVSSGIDYVGGTGAYAVGRYNKYLVYRTATASVGSISFGAGRRCATFGTWITEDVDDCAIPVKVYRIRGAN